MRRFALLLLLLCAGTAVGEERILDFQSDITVSGDGWIEVTETIRIIAEGDRIRRGIYRDFPTQYVDRHGDRYTVDFRPLAVLRNDSREDFHTQDIRDGKRVYFGSADRYLRPGEHTYTFHYRANRVLGFFENHDELYWNVTGFEWAFPIDRARATVAFAFDVSAGSLRHEAYTGPLGARASNYTSHVDETARVHFEAAGPLSTVNGLTVVVGWPKGFVAEPGWVELVGWKLRDNLNLMVALGGLLLLWAYYVPVWRSYGKDPEAGILVTRYTPPDGYSPASLRYIRQMYYDDKVMTAAVVNLAVKGYLRIGVDDGPGGLLGLFSSSETHFLAKTNPGRAAVPLAAGESELYEALFRDGDTVILEQENHELLGDAKSIHRESLGKDYKHHYFRWNTLLNVPAVLIGIATMAIALSVRATPLVALIGIGMLGTTIFFSVIMKAPTLRGRKVLDEMLGFKDYLEIAERDEMNLRNPPEKTPQLFEAYLPFALALGVDQQWSERFAAVLATVREPDGSGYHPRWYKGNWNSSSLGASTSQLSGALNSAIASSVTPPGSSSGGGGGGFSGGGGGGGGGGGW